MLTNPEKAAFANAVARDGLSSVFTEVQAGSVQTKGASALATLTPAITVTVQNWATLQTYAATPPDVAIPMIINVIETDMAAQNAARLGPLLFALYAAVKARGQ